jgi:hypothetical protein
MQDEPRAPRLPSCCIVHCKNTKTLTRLDRMKQTIEAKRATCLLHGVAASDLLQPQPACCREQLAGFHT